MFRLSVSFIIARLRVLLLVISTGLVAVWLGLLLTTGIAQYLAQTVSPITPISSAVPSYTNVPASAQPITLWGVASSVSVTAKPAIQRNQPQLQQAQKTLEQFRLNLLGIVITPTYRLAIIRSTQGEQTLMEGEHISPNLLLQRVEPDHVVVVFSGLSFTLWLDDSRLIADTSSNDDMDPLLAQQQYNEARIQEVAQSLRLKPLSIGQYVQFRTLYKNGQWEGVVVAPKDDPDVYRYLGFETNDIIRSVNGHSTNDIAQSDRLWRTFLTEERFEVQVERNGQLETVSIDLSQQPEEAE
jgi:type II secretion system protein C